MRGILIRWTINAIALFVVSHIVKGIEVLDPGAIIVAAIVLGIINAFIKPFLILITLPVNIMTLGIFTLFLNGALFYLVSRIVNGFIVNGFWPAFFGALVFSIVSFLLGILINERGGVSMRIDR